jgi:uncharacterized protein with NRDE domain
MCTLLVATRVWPEEPLLIAANRDERLDRPSAPPALRTDGRIPVLAPRDLQEGGTWWGFSARGVFAGITNRFGQPRDESRRSRGAIVPWTLTGADAETGARLAAGLDASDYNPFHLIVADRARAFLVWSDGAAIRGRELGPGIHFVTERSLGAASSGREVLLADRAASLARGPEPEDRSLRELLSFHGDPSFEGVCVHVPAWGYGTRSSSVLRLGSEARLLHAEGPPCSAAYEDYSPSVRSLLL